MLETSESTFEPFMPYRENEPLNSFLKYMPTPSMEDDVYCRRLELLDSLERIICSTVFRYQPCRSNVGVWGTQ